MAHGPARHRKRRRLSRQARDGRPVDSVPPRAVRKRGEGGILLSCWFFVGLAVRGCEAPAGRASVRSSANRSAALRLPVCGTVLQYPPPATAPRSSPPLRTLSVCAPHRAPRRSCSCRAASSSSTPPRNRGSRSTRRRPPNQPRPGMPCDPSSCRSSRAERASGDQFSDPLRLFRSNTANLPQ